MGCNKVSRDLKRLNLSSGLGRTKHCLPVQALPQFDLEDRLLFAAVQHRHPRRPCLALSKEHAFLQRREVLRLQAAGDLDPVGLGHLVPRVRQKIDQLTIVG